MSIECGGGFVKCIEWFVVRGWRVPVKGEVACFGWVDSYVEEWFRCLKEVDCILCASCGSAKDIGIINELRWGLLE